MLVTIITLFTLVCLSCVPPCFCRVPDKVHNNSSLEQVYVNLVCLSNVKRFIQVDSNLCDRRVKEWNRRTETVVSAATVVVRRFSLPNMF